MKQKTVAVVDGCEAIVNWIQWWVEAVAELGFDLKEGKNYIWYHIYARTGEHTYIHIYI